MPSRMHIHVHVAGAALEPNHTHFLLVENTDASPDKPPWGEETAMLEVGAGPATLQRRGSP